jgi:thiosulfate reductase cytochrome b subunit
MWGLEFLSLRTIAMIHLALAFAVLVFLIVHVYMTITGYTILGHVKSMVTGWEKVEKNAAIEDWEEAN